MTRLLIDTHVLLWAWEDSPRLGRKGRKLLADPDQPVVVSIVSLWEIAIKKSVGKLALDIRLEDLIGSLDAFGFELLPVQPAHTLALATLPLHHRDPFDRTLIAQAIHEKLPPAYGRSAVAGVRCAYHRAVSSHRASSGCPRCPQTCVASSCS